MQETRFNETRRATEAARAADECPGLLTRLLAWPAHRLRLVAVAFCVIVWLVVAYWVLA